MNFSSHHTLALLKFFNLCAARTVWRNDVPMPVSIRGLVVMVAVAVAVAVGCMATGAQAQTAAAVAATTPASAAAADAAAVPEAPAMPKYSAADIKTIFSYLDRNRDGNISPEEAAGFKGVARNFERADTNKDGVLSFEEFEFAMNRAK